MLSLHQQNVHSPSDVPHQPSRRRRIGPRASKKSSRQPPRFFRPAADILGHPPYYLQAPVVQYENQFVPSQAYAHIAQPTVEPYALPRVKIEESWLTSTPEPSLFIPWSTGPLSPVPYMGGPSQFPIPCETAPLASTLPPPVISSPAIHLSAQLQAHLPPTQAAPYGCITHPPPHRLTVLPEIRRPLLPPLPPDLIAQRLSVKTHTKNEMPPQVPFNQTDYPFDLKAIFREDSQFFPHRATTDPAAPVLDLGGFPLPTLACSCADTPTHIRRYGVGGTECSYPTGYIQAIRQRFSCLADRGWVDSIFMPGSWSQLSISEDDQGRTIVRSWLASNTGLTVWEELKNVFRNNHVCDGTKCTPFFIWFVLLMRQILVSTPYAQHLSALIRLGARDLDPCDPSFRFFSLKKAVWELLEAMAFRYTGQGSYDTFLSQQRELKTCDYGHLRVSMSESQFSAFCYQPLPVQPDKINYTDAFKACLTKIINDGGYVLDSLAIAMCLGLRGFGH